VSEVAVDFTRYNPPGVYVEDISTPLVSSAGIPQSITALVGPALGYMTATESVTISADAAAVLTNRGVFTTAVAGPPAVSAPVVKKLDGTVLTISTDYALSVDASGPGGGPNAVTSISRVSSSTNVADGDIVSITYSYADGNYYQPQTFVEYDSIMAVYGLPMVSAPPSSPNSSQVASPLSMGAKVAFENGASQLICVAINPADGTLQQQYKTAYTKLGTNYQASIIIPVFTDDLSVVSGTVAQLTTTLAQDLEGHCVSASAGGYARIGIFGAPRNYSETDQAMDAFAQAIDNKRLVLTYPNRLQIFNGSTNQITEVAGCFLAAALGGMLSSLPTNRGLTKESVTSFVGFSAPVAQAMTKIFKDTLSKSGVCVVEMNRLNQMLVRHGVTTDMSALTTREISLVRIADTLFEVVQLGMEASQLIGEPIDAEMPVRVKAALQSLLEQAVSSNLIVAYTSLTVRQQTLPSGDPSIIECKFAYQPALPLNFITVQFQVDLTSGTIGDTTALATATA
jgi:hypothetical protein